MRFFKLFLSLFWRRKNTKVVLVNQIKEARIFIPFKRLFRSFAGIY